MCKFVLFIALMSLCLAYAGAQFKIIGLLNVAAANEVAIDATQPHQSNAQGRGFSVVRGNVPREKPFSLSSSSSSPRPTNSQNNFIKVRIIENDSSTSLPLKAASQHSKNVAANLTKVYQLRQRPIKPPARLLLADTFRRRQHNSLPDNTNQVVNFNNAIDLKLHKSAKYRNHYKSKCSCERISNCAKIQISVSRCKPNYFLCCK